ncbi:MAG: tRNA (adenosine(37)-N6)-dimethylallyltransferase MiaA [Anaerolineales bacterium]|nr:tRNA (adenosine(37)-N6)-dimethylallyltransferase MiaA [Anaerolineales bacterium]
MRAPSPSVIFLVGPTAVGKTALALALAERLPAEIVSADSRYLYRGLDIGTAKPTPAERARVPHHLIDVTTPDQPWTLADVQQAAAAAIADILARGRRPLVVGGTGQYIRALLEGWQAPGGAPAPELRAALEADLVRGGVAALAERLRALDPASAEQVDLRNPRRVIRALEVVLSTGESFAAQRRKQPPAWTALQIGLSRPRPELYARIDGRIDAMLAAGLVAEVRGLAERGYGWELPAMTALGYRQIGAHLRGECDLAEAVRRLRHDTRVFVRRQANWFKPADPDLHWWEAGRTDPAELAEWLAARLERGP